MGSKCTQSLLLEGGKVEEKSLSGESLTQGMGKMLAVGNCRDMANFCIFTKLSWRDQQISVVMKKELRCGCLTLIPDPTEIINGSVVFLMKYQWVSLLSTLNLKSHNRQDEKILKIKEV